jgi:hypothetical protein
MTPKKEAEKVEEPKAPQYAGMNVYQRLHAVMKEIDYVQKEDKKVNNQYTFVSHDAVTAKCRKSFVAWGLITVPSVVEHVSEWCTRKQKAWLTGSDGKKSETMVDAPILRTTLKVNVVFFNIDDPSQSITTTAIGYGLDDQDKGVGKAYSYAVKYAYLKALGLETGDDPEREIHQEVEPIKSAVKMGFDSESMAESYNQTLEKIAGFTDVNTMETWWKEKKNQLNKLPKPLYEDVLEAATRQKTDILAKSSNGAGVNF